MALAIKTSTLSNVTLPLACDPEVIRANPVPEVGPWSVALYRETSDVRHPSAPLRVPADAGRVTLRPLGRAEVLRAEAAAGERSEADAAVFAQLADEVRALIAAGMTGPLDRVLSKLAPEQKAAYRRHEAWLEREALELARASLVSISDLPHLERGANGYPVEALQAMDDPAPGSTVCWPTGLSSAAVIWEIGQHVKRISTLGKALAPSSGSSSGSPTGTPSDGSATAPASAPGASQETTASPS